MTRWLVLLAASLACAAPASAAPVVKRVPVERNVELEVLDWGGSGAPLIFLAGFGDTAHTFDGLARKFTSSHHVYALTRRGFGKSSRPVATVSAYRPERLGADILAVMKALKIDRPFLAGHSFAGEELSEIGTRFPARVRGLIYLDAADAQAFYGTNSDVLYPIAGEVRRDLEALIGAQPSVASGLVSKLEGELPRLQRGLDWYGSAIKGQPDAPPQVANSRQKALQTAMVRGVHIYGPVKVPVLSIVALPIRCAPECDSDAAKRREKSAERQVADFTQANPRATVVRLPYADHFVWESNEKAVFDAMNTFMEKVRD
jgi:non-heme chloroperoxidase